MFQPLPLSSSLLNCWPHQITALRLHKTAISNGTDSEKFWECFSPKGMKTSLARSDNLPDYSHCLKTI